MLSVFKKEFLTTQMSEFKTGESGWNVRIYERQSARLSNLAPFLILNTMNVWYIDEFVLSQLHLVVPQIDMIVVSVNPFLSKIHWYFQMEKYQLI